MKLVAGEVLYVVVYSLAILLNARSAVQVKSRLNELNTHVIKVCFRL